MALKGGEAKNHVWVVVVELVDEREGCLVVWWCQGLKISSVNRIRDFFNSKSQTI